MFSAEDREAFSDSDIKIRFRSLCVAVDQEATAELRNRIRPVANRRFNITIAYAFLDKKRPLSERGRMEGTGRKHHVDSQIDATRNARNIVSSLGHGDRLFRL